MRRSNWGREMERQLFDRYHNDRLLRMDAINRAFRGGDIMFAYYQGGLIAEHLTDDARLRRDPQDAAGVRQGPHDGRGVQGRARARARGLRPPVQGVRRGDRRRLRDGAALGRGDRRGAREARAGRPPGRPRPGPGWAGRGSSAAWPSTRAPPWGGRSPSSPTIPR